MFAVNADMPLCTGAQSFGLVLLLSHVTIIHGEFVDTMGWHGKGECASGAALWVCLLWEAPPAVLLTVGCVRRRASTAKKRRVSTATRRLFTAVLQRDDDRLGSSGGLEEESLQREQRNARMGRRSGAGDAAGRGLRGGASQRGDGGGGGSRRVGADGHRGSDRGDRARSVICGIAASRLLAWFPLRCVLNNGACCHLHPPQRRRFSEAAAAVVWTSRRHTWECRVLARAPLGGPSARAVSFCSVRAAGGGLFLCGCVS